MHSLHSIGTSVITRGHIASFLPLGTRGQLGIVGSKTIFVLIILPIAFRNIATICGGSMGSPAVLIALTDNCPSGYWFLPRWPRFLLFCSMEVVLAGSGPELSLSSSMGLGGRHWRLLLLVGAYTDHTIQQVITRSLWKCMVCFVIINRVFITCHHSAS